MTAATKSKKAEKAKRPPFHEEFAEKIIQRLQESTAPWQIPWHPGKNPMVPHNPASGTVYRGMNRVHLALSGYDDPRWMTLKQANDNGYSIFPGSKATPVVYYQFSKEQDKLDKDGKPVLGADGKPEKEKVELDKPIIRFAHVFNAEQVDGIPPVELTDKAFEWEPLEKAENILATSGATIKHDQSNRAFYRRAEDAIHLPPKENFDAPDKYYSTALHELGHWTGDEKRLNREKGPFGSELYAREELRAEIASWMLGQEIGVGHDPDQHTAYVESWVKALQEDPYEIVRACRDAERIKEYILGLEMKKELQQESPENVVQQEKAAQRGKHLEKEEDIAAMGLPTDIAKGKENKPLFIVEIPRNNSESIRVWQAHDQEAFYKAVEYDARNIQGIYDKTTLREAIAPGIEAGFKDMDGGPLTLEGFKKEMSLPADLDPDMPIYRANFIDRENTDSPYFLEDPGKFKAYEAAWLHGMDGFIVEGKEEALLRLEQCKDLEQFVQAPEMHEYLKESIVGFTPEVSEQIKEQKTAKEKTFLAVPYKEKEQAKKLGAKWDKDNRLWYAPEGTDLTPLAAWMPEKIPVPEPFLSPQEEFSNALEGFGLDLQGKSPIMDGQIHRVPLIGRDNGERDGAYCGYLDDRPAGWMQDFRAGEKHNWVATGHELTKEQVEAQRVDNAKKQEQRKQIILEQQQRTAQNAFTEWISNAHAYDGNPYLQKKGVPAFGLRERIDGTLLVPVLNVHKEMRGLQTISPDGEKRFMYGMEKSGNFHMIGDYGFDHPGPTPIDNEGRNLAQGTILLAEGYATGATLHMATDKPVAVAFDAGNLEPVAKKLREQFPNATITICADNDHQHTRRTPEGTELWNKGAELAFKAAQEVGGKVVVPIFNDEERARGLTDYNDLHKSRGLDEVKRQVGHALQKDVKRGKSY